jgi:hypothetical protein
MRIIPSIEFIPGKSNVGSALSVIGPDFTFSRTTTPVAGVATRVNASGLIETVPDNVLRLDYPVTGGCPAALIEPAGTNLLLRSEEFNVSGTWTLVVGGTGVIPVVTPNAAIAPDGTQSADNIVLNVGSGTLSSDFSIIRQNITVSATAYTYSIWLKSNTGTNQFVSLRFNSAPLQEITITNDWQRFTFTGTPASGSRDFGLDLRGNNTSGQKTCNILAWGAQVETGAVATSYIPTTTASATRNADVCSVSGVSGYIGQTEGTIYAEVDVRSSSGGSFISIDVGDGSNFIIIAKSSNFTILVQLRRANGSVVAIITSSAVSIGVHKIALAYTNGNYVLYIDGNSGGISSDSTNYPASTLTRCSLANTSYGIFNDRLRAAAIYTTRLSDAQLIDMTWQ